jgi:hypothetical protein
MVESGRAPDQENPLDESTNGGNAQVENAPGVDVAAVLHRFIGQTQGWADRPRVGRPTVLFLRNKPIGTRASPERPSFPCNCLHGNNHIDAADPKSAEFQKPVVQDTRDADPLY